MDATVFDDIRSATVEKWRGMITELARLGIAVVVVSSELVRFHEGDSQDIRKLERFVPSWTFEENQAACRDDDFWQSIHDQFDGGTSGDSVPQRDLLMGNKFTVAGRSARFIFKNVVSSSEKTIRRGARGVGSMNSLEMALRNAYISGAITILLAHLQDDKNETTPQLPAVYPTAEDLTGARVTITDFALLEAEKEEEDAQPRFVSAFASNIEKLRNIQPLSLL